jgi:hypothetical protein
VEVLKSSSFLEEVITSGEIFVFSGPGGTGKSEVAANFATLLATRGISCTLVDLDFSKGDFTLRSGRFALEQSLILQGGKERYTEAPTFGQDVLELFSRAGGKFRLVVDLGRDERGLRVFRSLKPFWEKRKTHVVLVVNFARPFFEDVESYIAFVRNFREHHGVPFASLVANTHLMHETDPFLLERGWKKTQALEKVLNLPILFASLWERNKNYYPLVDWGESAVFAISRFVVLPWGEEDEKCPEHGL